MPRPKKAIKLTDSKVQSDYVDHSKMETIKGKQLIAEISGKCRYLSQLMTVPSKFHEAWLQQQWQEKVNDRLLKYPYIPGAKLFNKISSECWNDVYRQNQENETCFRNYDLREDQLINQIQRISEQITNIEEKTKTRNSV